MKTKLLLITTLLIFITFSQSVNAEELTDQAGFNSRNQKKLKGWL